MKRILIIDDDPDICTLLSAFLRRKDYEVATAHSGKSAMKLISENSFDLIISDFRLGDYDGIKILEEIRKINSTIHVIIITGYSDIRTAVKVIKSGAFDYVSKPLIPDEILLTIRKALASTTIDKAGQENKKAKETKNQETYITGHSDYAIELERQIDLVAPTNLNVIIYGESGSGKEAVAHKIHMASRRSEQAFVAIDCGALSKELAGSELFGHEKGAFTGALQAKTGQFEMANGGTLFLDEVSNLPYDVQVSLLRVVQERKLRKLGGTKEIPFDVRIVVASNEDLSSSYASGKFREDLYHRFNEFSLKVAPLRERGKDIIELAEHFLTKANQDLRKNIKGFDEDTIKCFYQYSWPGNIRELKNVITRAALLTDSEYIFSKTLPLEISNPEKFNFPQSINSSTSSESPLNLKNATKDAEYEIIMRAMKQAGNNKSETARILKIDRKTLYNKLKQFNIDSEDNE
ncbi:MAG: sigma-54-dependent Fis family transcriptional regulator [Bacteroidetes bacterium]|nr:MAG: sigma-54-dependent Fis family transcriptional regulator [Bacteroidota bacterium]